MLLNNIISKFWDQTHLDANLQLDEVEGIDDAFQSVYAESLSFSKLMLPDSSYDKVEHEYINGVSEFSEDVMSVHDLTHALWAGYHPTVLLFARLRWYGEKGIYHYSDADTPLDSDALSSEIDLARKFVSLLPAKWLLSLPNSEDVDKNIFQTILAAANARYSLDIGMSISFDEIVILSGMSRRAVQNDAAKGGDDNLKYAGADIENKDALAWLNERRNFTPTRPFKTSLNSDDLYIDETVEIESEGEKEYVFVPLTDDETVFLPEMRREAGYQVGKYGDEEYYLDYFEALKVIQDMDSPRFRRPNETGNWGIKNVVSWKRVLLSELQSAVARLS